MTTAATGEYEVVFDLLESGFQISWLIVFVAAFGAVGAVYAAMTRNRRHRFMGVAVSLLLFVLSGWSFLSAYADYERLREIAEFGDPVLIEGRIQDFYPGSPGGNMPGRFTVGDQTFSARDTDMPNAAPRSWPRDLTDACVRGAYVRDGRGNRIVWLGIKRAGCAA